MDYYRSIVKQVFDVCLGIRPGNRVWIDGWDHTLDLAWQFESECAKRNCPSIVTVRHENAWLRSILDCPKERLRTIPPQTKAALKQTDFYIFAMGPASPIPWKSIPREKRRDVSVWLDTRYDKSAYAERWARIARASSVKMLAVEATLATPERARSRGLNYKDWRNAMLRGCMVNHREIATRARTLGKFLSRSGKVRISTKSGTQLSLNLGKRPIEISDGIASEETARAGRVTFLPAGAIEVSVDEESAAGTIFYEEPVSSGSGTVEGLAVNVMDGSVHRCEAVSGVGLFRRHLREGGRNAGRLSYLGFGLNPNLRYGYGQDDKVLGGLTLGFGDNKGIGGRNPASSQWWASTRRATVEIDGATVLEEGKLQVGA